MLKISDTLSHGQKKELDVLENGETRREKTWKEAIVEAKGLIKHSDEIRFRIAELAMKCCSDSEGSKYTYARFSKEIGLGYTTLLEWVNVKKSVHDVLKEQDKTFLTYNQKRDLHDRTRGFAPGSVAKGKAVLKSLKQMKKENPDTAKFRNYLAHMKNVLFNAKDKHRTKGCDREVLAEILHVSREISKNLSWVDFEMKNKEA